MKAESEKQAEKNSKYFGVESSFLTDLYPGQGLLRINKDQKKIKIVPMNERIN